jgi:hypothetical protein
VVALSAACGAWSESDSVTQQQENDSGRTQPAGSEGVTLLGEQAHCSSADPTQVEATFSWSFDQPMPQHRRMWLEIALRPDDFGTDHAIARIALEPGTNRYVYRERMLAETVHHWRIATTTDLKDIDVLATPSRRFVAPACAVGDRVDSEGEGQIGGAPPE